MEAPAPIPRISFGSFELDPESGELLKNGRRIRLQDQPFQVLLALLEKPGRVVTREEFQQRLWSKDTFVDFEHGLNAAINRLRQVLVDSAEMPRYIETLPRRGYRFIYPVDHLVSEPFRPPFCPSPSWIARAWSLMTQSLAPFPPAQEEVTKPGGIESPQVQLSPEVNPPGALQAKDVREGEGQEPSRTQAIGRDARPAARGVKAIAAATALLLLGAFAFYFYWIGVRKATVARPQFKSLAVLPLQNFSADPEQEYFVDGMTEAVIADLAKIKALKVFSRTSVMPYKNTKKSMREIVSELPADALIEGSVMRSADRVRITVQLIDASSDQHLWAESYERDLKNVFALQGEVAQAIAQQVRAVITPQEQALLVKKRPVDPEVYELYLKGRHIMMRGGLEDVRKAIEYFQSGLAKDPNNALIYTGLADAYIYQMSDVHESPAEATAKSRAAAMKALELDESLAEAHTSLAMIKFSYDWDWTGGEIELKRAIELNPGYLEAYVTYGFYLSIVGRHPEALAYFEKARRLDPIDSWTYRGEGYSDFMAHKYDEAIEQYQKGLEIEPAPMMYFGLVLARAAKGDYATAISEGEKATKLNDSPLLLTSLASAYALAGRRADTNRLLRQLEEISKHQGPAPPWHLPPNRYVCPYEVAGVYAQLGEKDRAFEWLDKAYQSRSCMYWLRQDPRLDSLHSDSRFSELLAKMKFPL